MAEKSLIDGTVWYWRRGFRRVPMNHFREYWLFKTSELYTPVENEEQAQKMISELKGAKIVVEKKITHSRYDIVPEGSLIVFAALSRGSDRTEEEKKAEDVNITKLMDYIRENGGMMGDEEQKKSDSVIQKFLFSLFGNKR